MNTKVFANIHDEAYLLTLTFQITIVVESVTCFLVWERIMGRKQNHPDEGSYMTTDAFPNAGWLSKYRENFHRFMTLDSFHLLKTKMIFRNFIT